jgi:hypothetical protein
MDEARRLCIAILLGNEANGTVNPMDENERIGHFLSPKSQRWTFLRLDIPFKVVHINSNKAHTAHPQTHSTRCS